MSQISILKSKIHRATVSAADLDYTGSITLDPNLMNAAGLVEYEKVLLADITNGNPSGNLRDCRSARNGRGWYEWSHRSPGQTG